MPFNKTSAQPLSPEEKQKLVALLTEMRVRGVELPDAANPVKSLRWSIGGNGYFTKKDGRLYNPTEQHASFIADDSRFVSIFAGRGAGKTSSGAQKAMKKIMQGESGAVLNPDFENFKFSTWPEFREWIPWDMVVPSQRYRANSEWEPRQPFSMVFLNGAKAICKGLKDPDSARGPNINWLWYDEAGRDATGMAWKLAIAGVRIGKSPQAWVTTTPKGKEHWTYKFFVLKEIPEEALKIFEKSSDNRNLINCYFVSIEDNKDNLDPGFYASMLASYPAGWLRKQELEGQFADEGGVLGDLSWFNGKILPVAPTVFKSKLWYWDLAASEKKLISKTKTNDPDETVGTLMSWDGENFYIEEQVAGCWEWKKIKEIIIACATETGPYIPIYIEQEPGSGGKNQVAEIASLPELMNYTVRPHKPDGDKIMRANVWFSEAAQGKFFLVKGAWNTPFLNQLSSFPTGLHDDEIDSVSGARMCIAPIRKWRKMAFMAI